MLLQSKGITHPPHTLPAIEDPNTGAFIMDSIAIATYLDKTYPDTPIVLSPAACAVLDRVGDVFSFGSHRARANATAYTTANTSASAPSDRKMDGAHDLAPVVFLVLGSKRLNPVSKEYYHQTRAALFGERWTTLVNSCSASPEDRAESVRRGTEAVNGMLHKVTALYERHGNSEEGEASGPFALGKEPCFLDFMIAGRIKFVLDGLTPSEAEALALGGGKLARLEENLEKYYMY